MSPADQAERHDQNFIGAMTLLASHTARGSTARYGAIPVAVSGVGRAFFNGGWVLEPPDPLDLPKALDHLEAAGVPFVLHVGGDLPDVIRQAPALGLSDEGRLPCLALEQCELPPPAPGITIERVDRARWDGFTDVLAAGFGTPRSIPASLLPPGVLDHDQLRAYVGTVDGHPVATAVSVRTGKTIGIYAVATMPAARGRGFGTAMTWHTLADADPGWDIAVLQASEMGRPVYERMGFRQVREFAELVGGPEG